ncbi:MAG: macro domain-containing protein [Deltaproteobacteria bacterium]|nr:macro domain-containing protein [Deltaproteobacteria bacterium]
MIIVKVGDLFQSSAQTWVNTVNCVGIMGKGIALEFKQRFPEMFKDYAARCKRNEVRLGRPYIHNLNKQTQHMFDDGPTKCEGPEIILNFPTKSHWRAVSRLSDIIAGLEYLEQRYLEWGIISLAVPPLGCGHGQLEWRVVGPTLYRFFKQLDISVEMYAPHGTPEKELTPEFLSGQESGAETKEVVSMINPAWVALADIVSRIEQEPYHWPVGRTIFQKIAYFATALGLPTGLDFRRGSYGPFSPDLKQLTAKLVNNGILVEKQLGEMFHVKPGRTYDDATRVFSENLKQWKAIIAQVSDLFLRLKTHDAEIAATVYFVERELEHRKKDKPSEMEVLEEVKQWKQKRRPPLDEREIARTIRNLNILRWMNSKPSTDLPLPKDMMESAQ